MVLLMIEVYNRSLSAVEASALFAYENWKPKSEYFPIGVSYQCKHAKKFTVNFSVKDIELLSELPSINILNEPILGQLSGNRMIWFIPLLLAPLERI